MSKSKRRKQRAELREEKRKQEQKIAINRKKAQQLWIRYKSKQGKVQEYRTKLLNQQLTKDFPNQEKLYNSSPYFYKLISILKTNVIISAGSCRVNLFKFYSGFFKVSVKHFIESFFVSSKRIRCQFIRSLDLFCKVQCKISNLFFIMTQSVFAGYSTF